MASGGGNKRLALGGIYDTPGRFGQCIRATNSRSVSGGTFSIFFLRKRLRITVLGQTSGPSPTPKVPRHEEFGVELSSDVDGFALLSVSSRRRAGQSAPCVREVCEAPSERPKVCGLCRPVDQLAHAEVRKDTTEYRRPQFHSCTVLSTAQGFSSLLPEAVGALRCSTA